MADITKQDLQNIVDNAKNRVLERAATRQDLQSLQDMVKSLCTSMQQQQQLLRQSEFQRVQMTRHIIGLESRTAHLNQEVRTLRASLERLSENQPERILMPIQTDSSQTPEQRYAYSAV